MPYSARESNFGRVCRVARSKLSRRQNLAFREKLYRMFQIRWDPPVFDRPAQHLSLFLLIHIYLFTRNDCLALPDSDYIPLLHCLAHRPEVAGRSTR